MLKQVSKTSEEVIPWCKNLPFEPICSVIDVKKATTSCLTLFSILWILSTFILTLDLTALEEYRRGGDRLKLAPHLTDITEELDHNTVIGGITYDIRNEDQSNQFSVYSSGQHTDRKSFYGGLGGGRTRQDSISAANAYGNTNDVALLVGGQFTRNFKSNHDILTVGTEYNLSNTEDDIPGYNRYIDQQVNAVGAFAQYEWKPSETFTALIGGRIDHVNVDGSYTIQDINRKVAIDQTVISPRLTLRYQPAEAWQFRGGYARGFRAPQAFNEDLHVSSVGGEPQFVILSNDLETEYSNAYTASVNYSKNFKTHFLWSFSKKNQHLDVFKIRKLGIFFLSVRFLAIFGNILAFWVFFKAKSTYFKSS